jgi:hypothetical protein
MNNEQILYIHTIKYHLLKKKWSINTCYNINEPWKHNKWKKTDTKCHIFNLTKKADDSIQEKSRIEKSVDTIKSRPICIKNA